MSLTTLCIYGGQCSSPGGCMLRLIPLTPQLQAEKWLTTLWIERGGGERLWRASDSEELVGGQSQWQTSTSFALGYWSQFIINNLHNGWSATFQVKPNQSCFFHQPECSVLGIATHAPLHAVLGSNLHGPRRPSLTVMAPKLPLVCLSPYDNSNHTCSSRDSRSLLEPLKWQWTSDILPILPGFWCSFEYRII